MADLGDETWREDRWLEILSLCSTISFSALGWLGVAQAALLLAKNSFACMGSALPAPTQYVIDLAYAPISLGAIPVLLPTAVAGAGAWLRRAGWPRVGAALLLMAPQLALIGIVLCLAALLLPQFSLLPCR